MLETGLVPTWADLLPWLALAVAIMGLIYSLVIVVLASRLSKQQLWVVWIAGLLLLSGLCTAYIVGSFPEGGFSALIGFYMTAAAAGIPTGSATWVAQRLEISPTRRPVMSRVFRILAVFLLAVPVGVLVAAIPDMAALF